MSSISDKDTAYTKCECHITNILSVAMGLSVFNSTLKEKENIRLCFHNHVCDGLPDSIIQVLLPFYVLKSTSFCLNAWINIKR